MTDDHMQTMKGDLSMLRDFLFFWLFLPILILILIFKLLVQILFFTGIFCVAAGVTVVDLFVDLTRRRKG